MGMSKEQRIIKSLSPKHEGSSEPFGNFVLPNLSGAHDAGILIKTPTKDNDLVNKKYVDDSIGALGLPLSHTNPAEITDVGTNTHAQVDTHITTDVIKTAANVQAVAVGGEVTGTVGNIAITDVSIDHNALTNTHDLTTDIDHNSITNAHNLTTDIDHDQLTNFVANEHIDWTNATDAFLTTKTFASGNFLIRGLGTYTGNSGTLEGERISVTASPTANGTSNVIGYYGIVNSGTNYNINSLKGMTYATTHNTTGTVAELASAELVNTMYAGTVTNAYGLKLSNNVGIAGTVNTCYGIYLASTYTGTATTKYGIYQAGTADTNYFAGAMDVRGAVTINEAGADKDVRIEGDTDQNLFFTDGSTDMVGIGLNNPSKKLEVLGDIKLGLNNAGVLSFKHSFADLTISDGITFLNCSVPWKATGFISSDGTAGMTATRAFVDRAGVTNTVTIKNGLITAWTQV